MSQIASQTIFNMIQHPEITMDDLKSLPTTSANDAADNGPEKLLTTEEVAVWLGIKACTLEKARSTRIGDFPPFIRIGRCIRYRRTEVDGWLRRHSFEISGSQAFPAAA